MKAKHTPGPWVFIDDPSGIKTALELIVHPDADDAGGDSILYHGADWPVSEANARLIAAAPDLLLALQMMERFVGGPRMPKYLQDPYRMAVAAIKKATEG